MKKQLQENLIEPVMAPMQYRQEMERIKRFLHTPIGTEVGFMLGIRGFNQVQGIHARFKRYYRQGERLKRGEFTLPIKHENGTEIIGVYVRAGKPKGYNSRVDAGAALVSSLVSGSTLGSLTSPAAPKYIGLSTSALTPAKTDTTLSGETSATGLARVAGTIGSYTAPSVLDGGASYVVSHTFTNTSGAAVTIQSAALFDAASGGNMLVEANLSSSVTLQNNDQLILQWTVNN